MGRAGASSSMEIHFRWAGTGLGEGDGARHTHPFLPGQGSVIWAWMDGWVVVWEGKEARWQATNRQALFSVIILAVLAGACSRTGGVGCRRRGEGVHHGDEQQFVGPSKSTPSTPHTPYEPGPTGSPSQLVLRKGRPVCVVASSVPLGPQEAPLGMEPAAPGAPDAKIP